MKVVLKSRADGAGMAIFAVALLLVRDALIHVGGNIPHLYLDCRAGGGLPAQGLFALDKVAAETGYIGVGVLAAI